MAFRKKNINEIFGTVLVLSALLSTASAVDCFGKSFHCVNSTHFMICVDLGGGVSQSIDDFLIPCPPPTVCQGNNHFECEYPVVTTPSTTLSNVISETTEPWEEIVVTTNSPPKNTSTTKEYSEKYMNTVSIMSVADNLTTDTTVDVTTEAFSLSDVNSNSNVIEIISISPSYEVTTRVDGITKTVSDNIITGAAEVTSAIPQIIPLHQIQNVTNDTTVDNVTLTFSNTEPTFTLNNNYIFVQNDSVREITNITATSQPDNFTSRNITGDIVTADSLMIDTSTRIERPLTSITDESYVTTTTQTLVSTDEFQNSANINIQTTTAQPTLIQNTFGKEQFQVTGFEENFITESVQNSEKEQSNVSIPDVVQNVPAQQPIITYQSTGTTVTNMDVKNEVAVETTIASEQSTTTTSKVNLLTTDHDIYTTEAPLTISTNRKLDRQNSSQSDQVPTKSTDDAIVYRGDEKSTTDINILPKNIDVTTEQPTAFTTTTEKLLVTEQLKINKDIPVTEQVQNLIDTESPKLSEKRLATDPDMMTEKPSDLATETQQKQGNEQIIITKNTTTIGKLDTQNSSKSDQVPTKLTDDEIVYRRYEQSTTDINILPTNIGVTTEQPIVITTETQNLFVTEQLKINKDIPVTEQVQNLIDTGIESPKLSEKKLATDPDVITEKPSDLATETQQKQGNEQIIITKNITTIRKLDTQNSSKSDQVPTKLTDDAIVYRGNEQSTTDIDILPTNIDVTTEQPIVITTETQKLLVTEQLKINKDIPVTEQIQNLIDTGIELPKLSEKNLATDPDIITEKPSDLATEKQQKQGNEQIIITKNITTIRKLDTQNSSKSDQVPTKLTDDAIVYRGNEQSTTDIDILPTNIDVTTEQPIVITTETQKLLVTEQLKINKDIPVTEQVQNLIDTGIESPKLSEKKLATDPDIITEKPSDLATETQPKQGNEQIIITKNITTIRKLDTQNSSKSDQVPTKLTDDAIVYRGNEQSTTDIDILPTNIDVTTEQPIVITTETQKLLVTEQLKINKDIPVTEQVQNLIDTGIESPKLSEKNLATDPDIITEKPSDLATEKQQKQGNEQIIITKNITTIRKLDTQNSSKSDQVPTKLTDDAIVYRGNEQSTTDIDILPTNIDVTTEQSIVITTETQKLLVTEQLKINKDIPVTEQVQNLIDTGIELPKLSEKNLATDPDIITEKPSDLATEKQQKQGNEQIIITKNITTIRKLDTQNSSKSDQVPTKLTDDAIVYRGNEQRTTDIDILTTNIDVITEQPIVITTETQKLLVTEQLKINKDIPVTEQVQNLIDTGIESPKLSEKKLANDPDIITEKPSDLATETQQKQGNEQIIITKNITTIRKLDTQNSSKSDQVPTKLTDDAIVYRGNEQSIKDINILPTNIDVTTEQPIVIITETQKLLVTEQLKINEDFPVLEQVQNLIDTGIESPKLSEKRLATDHDIITEKLSNLATETQQEQGNEKIIITKNTTTTGNDAAAGVSVLPTEAQKSIEKGVQQSKDNTQSLNTDNDVLTENLSELTTEIQKLLVTEPPKINKYNSAIEQGQKLNDSIIESPKSSEKRLATDLDIIIEKPSDLATETQQEQGNEQIIINKNITTAGNNVAAEVTVLPKEVQKPIEIGIQQSKFSKQSLATDNDTMTENPSELATETPKQVRATPLTTDENRSATGNDVLTETSVLPLETQTLTHNVVEQRKIGSTSSPTVNVSAFSTVTQQSVYFSTELLSSVRSDLSTDNDITTEKPDVYTTVRHEPTKQITEEENIIFTGSENTTTNENYLSFDNNATVNSTSDITTEAQKPIYTGTEQPITRTKSTATDTIAENSVLDIEIQKPSYMNTPQPMTKATDIDVNVEKANVSTIVTHKSISTSTELPITIKNDLATDIKVTTETTIDSATGTSKPTIQIQEEVALELSDYNIETEKQKQEGLTTDTNTFAVLLTTKGVAVQSFGVTEQPITTALVDSIVPDTTISNVDKFDNNISSNTKVTGTIVVQSINTTTATTEPTTVKIAEDKMKGETTATSSVKASDSDVINELPVDNVQIIHNSIDEQPNKKTAEVTADTVASLIPITVQIVNIKKDNETATATFSPNLSNGHQLYTNIDDTDISNGITTDTSFDIINEVKDLNSNTVKPTQDTQSVVEIVNKNKHTTKINVQVTGTAFATEQTKIHINVDLSEAAISNNAVINENTNKTVKVNSEIHTTERVNLILPENNADQLPTKILATTDLGSISTFNLNPVINSMDLNLQKNKNQSKNTTSVHLGQLTDGEATSETTATENFTPSLNPNSESSLKNKHLTSNNQVTTEIINTVIDNLAEGKSLFTTATASNTILQENGNIYKTPTSLNTPDNSYVSFTTEDSASFHNNIANNQIPKFTTKSENEAHEISPVNYPNNEVDHFTSIPTVIENTETSFTKESTSVGGIDYESHVSTKNNKMDQHVEITTQIFSTRRPMQTIESNKNENTNNLLSNPLYNILLDKINEVVIPVTESSTSFRIKNDGNINSTGILSFGTYSVIDNGSTQLPQIQNANGVPTQASIPIVTTNDNLPSSPLDSLTVAGDLHKTKDPASIAKTENLSIIQPETSFKETSITKEEGFSIKDGVKNVYKTIESYFNTPFETSTPGSFDEEGNADSNHILSSHDFSTKTSSSMYNTESSLYGTKDSRVSKSPVTYSGYSTKTTKIEMSTEPSKNKVEGYIVLNKPVISADAEIAVPDNNTEINTSNINKSIPIASHGTKTSDTKTLQEPYNSATYNPSNYVTSAMNDHQYVTEKSDTRTYSKSNGSTVNIFPEAIVSSQQSANSFKTVAKSLSGKSNEKNLVHPNKSQYNSSFYADTANFGSKLTIATESTDFKSPNNLSNAADKQSFSKSYSNFTIATSQVTEKVARATNTNKDVNSAIKENKLQNNSSFGHSTVTVAPLKNMSQDINKNGSLSTNAIKTTKFNTQGDLKSPPKTTTNSTKHNPALVEPITTKQNKINSVITTSQAPIKKITPRPVVPTTTTENPSKQIPKTALANFSCINGIRGRYSDKDDCRKFYICIGNSEPIVGNCPANTVFSDISKLCTKNLSHCIRENEFKCPSAGRFSDVTKDNVYYICVSYKNHLYRFKFQCQKSFTLNKTTIKCEENRKIESNQSVSIPLSENSNDGSTKTSSSSISSASSSSISDSSSMSTSSDKSSSSSSNDSSSGNSDSSSSKYNSNGNSGSSSTKSKNKKESKEKPEGKEGDEEDEVFECEKEGKFPVRNDCRRYYLCKKNGKSEYRRKIKKCESGEVFHKGKKNNKNSSESNDSESDGDRRPSNRRQRKEKKEKRKRKEDEDDDQDVFKCEREGKFSVSGDCKQEKKESKLKPEDKEGDEEDDVFECEKEGKFPIRNDCKRYYLCKKNRKSEYRRKIKKCDSDEVFHKSKKKCVDADSYEC